MPRLMTAAELLAQVDTRVRRGLTSTLTLLAREMRDDGQTAAESRTALEILAGEIFSGDEQIDIVDEVIASVWS